MSQPLEQYRPFGVHVDSIGVPIECPEGVWTKVAEMSISGLPNGTYIINGGLLIRSDVNNKSALARDLRNGVVGTTISISSGDPTDVIYIPFRVRYLVTDGNLVYAAEVQTQAGAGTDTVDVLGTFLDYERKLEGV